MPDEKKQRKVELTTTLDASTDVVWKALTEAEELKRWFPLDAAVNAAPNAEIRLSWGEGHTWKFKIAEAVQHKYLKLVYQHGSDFPELGPDKQHSEQLITTDPRELTLEYFLETGQGQTFLRLVHSGFSSDTDWDEEYSSVSRGWHSEMQSLKHYLKYHLGRNRMVAWPKTSLPENISVGEAWDRLLNGAGSSFTMQGQEYRYLSPAGDSREGSVLFWNPPWDFSGTVRQLNNAMLRICIETFGRHREASVWLSAYDLPSATVEAFQQEWENRLHELFAL